MAIRTVPPVLTRSAGLLGLAVTWPVGLEHVPLLGGTPGVVLEVPSDLLGDPGHVGSQRVGSRGVDRTRDDRVVVDPGPADPARGDQGGPGAQGKGGRPAGECGALAEELDLDAVTDDVTI